MSFSPAYGLLIGRSRGQSPTAVIPPVTQTFRTLLALRAHHDSHENSGEHFGGTYRGTGFLRECPGGAKSIDESSSSL